MNIYKVALKCDASGRLILGLQWDFFDAHVVQAASEEEARNVVTHSVSGGDERSIYYGGENVWFDPEKSTCELIGCNLFSTETKIILSSFNAG